MTLQSWIPEPARRVLEQLSANPICNERRRLIFNRLSEDRRMESVYRQFFCIDRKTGTYLYPAKASNRPSAEDAQAAALREVLQLTISAASDGISVFKIEEIEEARTRLNEGVTGIRSIAHDLALAAQLGVFGLDDPMSRALSLRHLQALNEVANWLEHLKSKLRAPNDPLVVDRHRGNPVARGVQTIIAVTLEEQLGRRLDGTAATLTEVALDTTTTARVSRSALTRKTTRKKRTSA